MKKILLMIFFITSLFASEVKELKSMNQLEEDKNIFLMFSTSYCPWCTRQTYVLENIEVHKDNLQIFKVKDNSDIYKELLKKYPFVIEYFPTSYIVAIEDGELDIKYEFQGYQKEENILKVLNDKDIIF